MQRGEGRQREMGEERHGDCGNVSLKGGGDKEEEGDRVIEIAEKEI